MINPNRVGELAGGVDWRDLELTNPNVDRAAFVQELSAFMGVAKEIRMDVTNMRWLKEILYGVNNFEPGSTAWELRTIWDNPALRSKLIIICRTGTWTLAMLGVRDEC